MNECPQCGRVDKIEKVSAIVQKGTHQIEGQIPVSHSYDSDGWKTGTNYGKYNVTQQSNLAEALTFNAPSGVYVNETPRNTNINPFSYILGYALEFFGTAMEFIQGIVMLFVLALLVFGGLIKVFGAGVLGYVISSLGAIVIPTLVIWWVVQTRKKTTRNEVEIAKKWQYSKSRWNQLYYCYRDDCIFIPQESKAYSVSELYDVIDWHPPVSFWQKLARYR